MPELPRSPEQLGEKIGKGVSSHVYEDRQNPDVVIKETSDLRSPDSMKVRHYLHKIAHLLYPDSVPSIHASFYDTNTKKVQSIIDRVDTSGDTDHEMVRTTVRDSEDPFVDVFDNESEIEDDERFVQTKDQLLNAGFVVDRTPRNYSRTESGSWYLDSFGTGYDQEKLLAAINEISDEKIKQKAFSYLNRIREIKGYK